MIYPHQLTLALSFDEKVEMSQTSDVPTLLGPLHLHLCKGLVFTSKNQLPVVKPSFGPVPKSICAVHRLLGRGVSAPVSACYPHFFTSDSHIEPVWRHPNRYAEIFKMRFKAILSTDFSIYMNMLRIQKYWNDFRNKFLAAFFQSKGIDVVPAPSWADISDIEHYMEGWPHNCMIALNSTGVGVDRRARHTWLEGYNAVLGILHPTHILRYGTRFEEEEKIISTYYPNNNKEGYRYGSQRIIRQKIVLRARR